ncbi:MAG: hypothetical protein L0Y54_15640 [Sporichthyaceae bacterium]|nr:hypothetical protein [Sporichthyaceae bacterium]
MTPPSASRTEHGFRGRLRSWLLRLRACTHGDRGFGTVEWVLIGFFVAGMAIAVGVLLFNAVESKGEDVRDCIAGSVGCEAP